jgi:hypothetical protein
MAKKRRESRACLYIFCKPVVALRYSFANPTPVLCCCCCCCCCCSSCASSSFVHSWLSSSLHCHSLTAIAAVVTATSARVVVSSCGCGSCSGSGSGWSRVVLQSSQHVSEMADHTLKSGYLIKQGHFRRNWLKRWWTLRASGVLIYSETDRVCILSASTSIDHRA